MPLKNGIQIRPFRLDCPICGEPIPFFAFGLMNSQGFHKIHVCPTCRTALSLSLTKPQKILTALLVTVPVFVLSSLAGFHLMAETPHLSFFHEGRGHREPNFLGFVIAMVVFVLPATVLSSMASGRVVGTVTKAAHP